MSLSAGVSISKLFPIKDFLEMPSINGYPNVAKVDNEDNNCQL